MADDPAPETGQSKAKVFISYSRKAALFRRTAELPLSRGARGLQVSRMLTLLDLAISTCAQADRQDFIRDLIELWTEVYKDWQPFFAQSSNAGETMALAVEPRRAGTQNPPRRAKLWTNALPTPNRGAR